MDSVVDYIVEAINKPIENKYSYDYFVKEDEDHALTNIVDEKEWFKNKLNEKLDPSKVVYNSVDTYDFRSHIILTFTYNEKRCEIMEKYGREYYWVVYISEAV